VSNRFHGTDDDFDPPRRSSYDLLKEACQSALYALAACHPKHPNPEPEEAMEARRIAMNQIHKALDRAEKADG